MNILNYLKESRIQLLEAKKQILDNVEQYNIDTIKIVIENANNIFENEEEIIKKGAQNFLENGSVTNIEEGIIVFATIIRGLKYKGIEKDENGNKIIILADVVLEKLTSKTL